MAEEKGAGEGVTDIDIWFALSAAAICLGILALVLVCTAPKGPEDL